METDRVRLTQRIRFRLMVMLFALFIPSAVAGGFAFYTVTRTTVQTNIESELNNSTASIFNMVKTAAAISIKNRLRAIAEKNKEIAHHIWSQYKNGKYTREEAASLIRDILLSQKIGKTGYIYCVDSSGTAAVHPYDEVQNANWRHMDFVLEQTRLKEGYTEYLWKNPDDEKPRAKAMYYTHFKPLDWIISVSTYKDEFLELVDVDDFRRTVLGHRFGKSGYAYVVDMEGNLLIHPILQDYNISQEEEQDKMFFNQMVEMKNGNIRYWWKNPGEAEAREKLVAFRYLPDFKWIVASSSYVDEVFHPVKTIGAITIISVILVFLALIILSYYLSHRLLKSIEEMRTAFEKGAGGDFSLRLTPRYNDELGRVAIYFNTFMEKLGVYYNDLKKENQERLIAESNLKEKEKQLAISNRMLKLVLDTIPVRVFWKDRNAKFLGCNLKYAQDFGLTFPDQILGQDEYSLFPAEQAAKFNDEDRNLMNNNRAKLNYTGQWKRPDGKTAWARASKIPLIDDEGEVIGLIGAYEDITEYKISQKQIAVSQARYQSLFASSPDGIAITDIEGSFLSVNKSFSRITGYSIDELKELNYQDITDKGFSTKAMGLFEGAFNTEEQKSLSDAYEIDFIRKDGTSITLSLRGWVIRDEAYQPIALGAFVRDVTEQKTMLAEKAALEHQLINSQKIEAIGTLAGGIAHDFNNILSGIIGYAELLLLNPQSGHEKVERYGSQILNAGNRARDLVNQILQFSRQEKPEICPVDLISLINEIINLLQATLPKNIIINKEFEIEEAEIMADAAQMHQVLMNLCTNASQAMGEPGGELTISLAQTRFESMKNFPLTRLFPGEFIKVQVADTGDGIAPETLERIFEPYFTTKSRGEGTGLGLSVTLGIIKGHNGAIDVKSKPGQGTVFTIFLPVADASGIASTELQTSLPQGAGESILLVDDENMSRDVVELFLSEIGYHIVAFSGSVKALEAFRSKPDHFDLIITDQSMPEMTGVQLSSEIRKINEHIPIIICTGFSEQVNPATVKQYGINDFLMKPIGRSDLAHTVRETLEARKDS